MKKRPMKQTAPAAPGWADRKTAYSPPQVEIIEMDAEGVIAGSGMVEGFDEGGNWGNPIPKTSTRRGYNAASDSELEDLINDILTVEQ